MYVSLIADTVSMCTQQTLGSTNLLLLHRQNCINLADQSSQICAVIVDALAPLPVKLKNLPPHSPPKAEGAPGGDRKLTGIPVVSERSMGFSALVIVVVCLMPEGAVMVAAGERGISKGTIGMKLRGGFLRGLRVIYWTALSNCVHFSFKKVVRIVADGIGDTERGKAVPLRLTTIC
uniref:Uncharacterized protein n=1 Tax=Salix viminalis TaxID=40686 RepID=A0A6N2MWC4_SALVM